MTLNTGIFDVSDPQNPDRVYSAALLSRILSKHIRDGVVHDDGNEMAVTVTDPPAMRVLVGTGTAMIRGRFCENDAALTLSVPAAHATYPRIDRVVVRLNASPGRTIDIVVKAGTAAPRPAAPALTRTAETWELSLAQVRVEAGATSILSAKITDERGSASLCGVAAPAYVPSSQVEVVGAINMQGQALTGLPAPSGATDAATKGYIDTAAANRSMNGYKITNLGTPTAATDAATKAYADGVTAQYSIPCLVAAGRSPETNLYLGGGGSSGIVATVPASITDGYAPGTLHTVWIQYDQSISVGNYSVASGTFSSSILVNGIVVARHTVTTSSPNSSQSNTVGFMLTIKTGDVITVRADGSTGIGVTNTNIGQVSVSAYKSRRWIQ